MCPFRWKKNLYFCFYCDQQFMDPTELRQHHSQHDNIPKTQLKLAMSYLKKHEVIKVDITELSCKLCNTILVDLQDLKSHLNNHHDKNLEPNTDDGVLPFKFSTENYQCALCEEKYDEYKTLNHHMNVHYQNFICEQCGAGFVTPDRLRVHSFSHESGNYQCTDCDKVFRSNNARNEHHALVHLKVKRHRCPQCSETFRNYFQRSKHLALVHGSKLKEFKCDLCPKVFRESGKLGVHIQTAHLKMKRHACNVCPWKFYSKSELKHHMIKHSGERNFQCSVCNKAYARKHTLREHLKIHNNDRRFACSTCDKTFIQACSLKLHLKIHHSSGAKNCFEAKSDAL